MRVPSISSNPVRVAPQQERAARRLAGFLQAAAELFAELGFEATTMQAIADRSTSSIGALYNYFPDKQAVATTLMREYSQELRSRLQELMAAAARLTVTEFANAFIDCISTFVRERPAWLNLLASPVQFRRDLSARKALRTTIADAFREKNPSLSPERALLTANVVVQIVKGMMSLYMESEKSAQEPVIEEFRKVITAYFEEILSGEKAL